MMIFKNIFTLCIILIATNSFSQTTECNLQKENKAWLAEFRKTDNIPDQLSLIIQKIKSDTVYTRLKSVINKPHSSRIHNYVDKNNNLCGTKILFTIDSHKIDLNERPSYIKAINELSTNQIESITFIEPKMASALFGSHGNKGAVMINSKNEILNTLINKAHSE
ncbi:hypothetical protein [Joostella sp.]|uniref:hypothetical protein n=1 Tax=Joostella sp. TaxID=2231138 RepID=UPI003A95A5B5